VPANDCAFPLFKQAEDLPLELFCSVDYFGRLYTYNIVFICMYSVDRVAVFPHNWAILKKAVAGKITESQVAFFGLYLLCIAAAKNIKN